MLCLFCGIFQQQLDNHSNISNSDERKCDFKNCEQKINELKLQLENKNAKIKQLEELILNRHGYLDAYLHFCFPDQYFSMKGFFYVVKHTCLKGCSRKTNPFLNVHY